MSGIVHRFVNSGFLRNIDPATKQGSNGCSYAVERFTTVHKCTLRKEYWQPDAMVFRLCKAKLSEIVGHAITSDSVAYRVAEVINSTPVNDPGNMPGFIDGELDPGQEVSLRYWAL